MWCSTDPSVIRVRFDRTYYTIIRFLSSRKQKQQNSPGIPENHVNSVYSIKKEGITPDSLPCLFLCEDRFIQISPGNCQVQSGAQHQHNRQLPQGNIYGIDDKTAADVLG